MESPYTLDDVLFVFKYYFDAYEQKTTEPHPPLKKPQIVRIIQNMPYYDSPPNAPGCADIDPESYPVLIDSYFRTPFINCNYRINHFFSGDVRTMRMYEELY